MKGNALIAYTFLLIIVCLCVLRTGLLWPLYALLLTPFFTRNTIEKEEVANLRAVLEQTDRARDLAVKIAFERGRKQGLEEGMPTPTKDNKEIADGAHNNHP